MDTIVNRRVADGKERINPLGLWGMFGTINFVVLTKKD
jgi:hypothetical protein